MRVFKICLDTTKKKLRLLNLRYLILKFTRRMHLRISGRGENHRLPLFSPMLKLI
jgi:hypothetical protein